MCRRSPGRHGSGFSVAIAATRSGSTDTYYACVAGTGSSAGKVNASTIKLGSPPTKCPKTTDVVKSWNVQGLEGPQGVPGVEGPRGPAGAAAPVAKIMNVALGGGTIAPGDAYLMTAPVDVSDCERITSVHARFADIQEFDGMNVFAVVPGVGPVGSAFAGRLPGQFIAGGGMSQTWYLGSQRLSMPSEQVSIQLSRTPSAQPQVVMNVWLTCQTFGG